MYIYPPSNTKDVFILGAGFSRAVSPKMPLMCDLAESLKSGIDAPFVDAINGAGGDLEQALTYLAQGHPWLTESERLRNRATFLDASRKIASEIDETTLKALMLKPEDWLMRFVHYLHDERCTVITLN